MHDTPNGCHLHAVRREDLTSYISVLNLKMLHNVVKIRVISAILNLSNTPAFITMHYTPIIDVRSINLKNTLRTDK
jgi:hypothetical protein